MIVEDEGVAMAERPIDLNDAPGASITLPPEVHTGSNNHPCLLKEDLIEHIWQWFLHRRNNYLVYPFLVKCFVTRLIIVIYC
jgi:hypothetical protein